MKFGLGLMIESPHDLSIIIAQIQETLTNSNFPFKVDIVEFKNFAESYKSGYQRDKVRLFTEA